MKKVARSIVASILGWQIRRLRKRNSFKIIGVVGSIGKTSTKLAVAQVMGANARVCYQNGNYNDLVSVPLVFFGHAMPPLLNPFAWLRIFILHEIRLLQQYPYDVVVLELGTDGPGQIASFAKYLKLDIAIVTAITPEHMEFFDTLDDVAAEELSVLSYAESTLINYDLVPVKYVPETSSIMSYGLDIQADYHPVSQKYKEDGIGIELQKPGRVAKFTIPGFSKAQLYSALAAIAVVDIWKLDDKGIGEGLKAIEPVSGRMQLLDGIKDSRIIDDSYNASPEAVVSALDTLYRIKAPQKIALLGAMNELGDFSQQAHEYVGEYCDPSKVDEIITLGPDSNEYLAKAARAAGCRVVPFDSPYKAGEYIASVIKPGAVVLVKGSQNRVFAEEAIKSLLKNPDDAAKLVRQSDYWMQVKSRQFS